MLFYLLSAEELRELFARMGYRFTRSRSPRRWTTTCTGPRGSTLSGVVHAWVLARGNRARAMRYFQQVLASDVADIQGGTTAEGIHIAAMAGSIDLLQRCFTRAGNPLGPADTQPNVAGKPWRPSDADLLPRLPVASDRGRSQRGDQRRPADHPPIEVECRERVQTLTPGTRCDSSSRGSGRDRRRNGRSRRRLGSRHG